MSQAFKDKTEIAAGLTTFLSMAYIIVVNPSILSTEGTGMSFSGVLAATVLLCFSMTLFMGLYAKLPFAIAPGMGVNAFFAYTLVLGKGIPWQTALGMLFWSGLICVVISLSPLRVKVVKAIPIQLRNAAAIGIGLFLTFIGLKNSGFIVAHPVTFVTFAKLNGQILLSLVGLFVTIYFLRKKSPLAFLIGISTVTVLAWLCGYVHLPENIFSTPDFESVMFKLDIMGALKLSLLPAILALFFTDFFDSISTFMGVSQATQLTDANGDPKNLREGLIVDSVASLSSGFFGTSPGTAYIESASGIEVGGRSGKTAVVTALCFLPFLFVAPLASIVPSYATAPVLILVGFLMFKSIGELSVNRIEEAIPAFLTIVLIPLTFSITQGIIWGFLSHVICYLLAGRAREIRPTLYVLAIVSALLIVFESSY